MSSAMIERIVNAVFETLYMVILSGFIGTVLGVAMGVALYITRRGNFLERPLFNRVLSIIVNIGRSVPFIILALAIVPFTQLLVGTFIGNTAAVVPLTLAAIPFVARLVEGALLEVPDGLIEAAQAMGATPQQIIFRVLLPEAAAGIITAITVTFISLIGYSAMAGGIGAGGLGAVAINYGYNRYDTGVMLITVIIMIVMVQGIQTLGDRLVRRAQHR
ncbi:D-methionine transport system permease protein [Kushneria sinocarnis]|uniref:D-methionine transport system permease protein n=1 Tax=Kushneria sinocarnis TaxID=595502 RepID=A0A420WXZ1_9GAMM|nr:methionine ABC transporter permease [Kushneria sinocarnis]RKR06025.1 D-methionine transport system permease protein [Kushneria sinocarnis]